MSYFGWHPDFLAQCAANFVKTEKKFANEQLQYLREYYTITRCPEYIELQAIAKLWDIDSFDTYLDLEDWFFGQRMAEAAIAQRREEARRAAA